MKIKKNSNSKIIDLDIGLHVNGELWFGIITAINIILTAVAYYFMLPAINLSSSLFWIFLFSFFGIETVAGLMLRSSMATRGARVVARIPIVIIIVLGVIVIVAGVYGKTIFHAKRMAKQIEVKQGEIADLPTDETNIALMDTNSAKRLGNKKLGSLGGENASQYKVGGYAQLNVDGQAKKVAPIEYADDFKALKNTGTPGYMIVDPRPGQMKAELVETAHKMKYTKTAVFSHNAVRRMRMKNPTALIDFDNMHFEIDDKGKGWYVATTYKRTIGLYKGMKVTGIITLDPVSGKVSKYSAKDIPEWVDYVMSGNDICMLYDWYGTYHKGYWNSRFGQSGVTETTYDFGYICQNNDVYIYTGVTSAVTEDDSNMGFLVVNARTLEYEYIKCEGSSEQAAMDAAEGSVSDYGYQASFPSLVMVNKQPTYVLVLKDDSGLVKKYAYVNARQISKIKIVDAGDDANGEDEEKNVNVINITVASTREVVVDGNTYTYIVDTEGDVFSSKTVKLIESGIMSLSAGDSLKIEVDDKNEFVVVK